MTPKIPPPTNSNVAGSGTGVGAVVYVPVKVSVVPSATLVSRNTHVAAGSVNDITNVWVPPPPPMNDPVTSPVRSSVVASNKRLERSSDVSPQVKQLPPAMTEKSETVKKGVLAGAPRVIVAVAAKPGVGLVSVKRIVNWSPLTVSATEHVATISNPKIAIVAIARACFKNTSGA